MKADKIKKLITDTLGIKVLNPMQLAVLSSTRQQIILLSPTGSGKTIAFAAATLRLLDDTYVGRGAQALIITPSRELTLQVYDVIRPVARGFKTVALYGGHPMEIETKSLLASPADIVIATPGRLLDHLERHTLDISHIKALVIDEYDKALELGFKKQMADIARRLPRRRGLTLLTSATPLDDTPPFVDPATVHTIKFNDQAPQDKTTVMQVNSPTKDKLETLSSLLLTLGKDKPAIVFVNHRESADRTASWLRTHGIGTILYHGGLEQRQREIAVAAFTAHASSVMIATDLAGRGLDIDDLAAVIHYHLPGDSKIYTHRNGRTARAGAEGEVYVIIGPDETMPDFITIDGSFTPDAAANATLSGNIRLMYIDAGKRDKISRGDIAGFVMKSAGIQPDKVGKIFVASDYSLVAIDGDDNADRLIAHARANKLKGKRVRISHIS